VKKAALILSLILLAACSAQPAAEAPAAEPVDLEAQLAEKDTEIAVLENQVETLTEELTMLQNDYNDMLSGTGDDMAASTSLYCEARPETMKYQNPASAIAILEGWFALQPQVAEFQGTYSTAFWSDVNSRIHTIRYIDADTGLSETATFLIFFEEGGWREGLLNMSDQCWLDYPE